MHVEVAAPGQACGESVLELVTGNDLEHQGLAGDAVSHLLGGRLQRALVREGRRGCHDALEEGAAVS